MGGVGAEMLCADLVVLAADHAPQPREELSVSLVISTVAADADTARAALARTAEQGVAA